MAKLGLDGADVLIYNEHLIRVSHLTYAFSLFFKAINWFYLDIFIVNRLNNSIYYIFVVFLSFFLPLFNVCYGMHGMSLLIKVCVLYISIFSLTLTYSGTNA